MRANSVNSVTPSGITITGSSSTSPMVTAERNRNSANGEGEEPVRISEIDKQPLCFDCWGNNTPHRRGTSVIFLFSLEGGIFIGMVFYFLIELLSVM